MERFKPTTGHGQGRRSWMKPHPPPDHALNLLARKYLHCHTPGYYHAEQHPNVDVFLFNFLENQLSPKVAPTFGSMKLSRSDLSLDRHALFVAVSLAYMVYVQRSWWWHLFPVRFLAKLRCSHKWWIQTNYLFVLLIQRLYQPALPMIIVERRGNKRDTSDVCPSSLSAFRR